MRLVSLLLGWLALLTACVHAQTKPTVPLYEPGVTWWIPYNVGQTITLTWKKQTNAGYRDIWLVTYHYDQAEFSQLISTRVNMDVDGQYDYTIKDIPNGLVPGSFIVRYLPSQQNSGTSTPIFFRPGDPFILSVGFEVQPAANASSSASPSTTVGGASNSSVAETGAPRRGTSVPGTPVPGTPSPLGQQQQEQQQQDGGVRLSTGALAGIVVGAVLGAGAVAGVIAWWLLRAQRSRRAKSEMAELAAGEDGSTTLTRSDLDAGKPDAGPKTWHELGSAGGDVELPGSIMVYAELPSGEVTRQNPNQSVASAYR